jgi:hypothetical protein
MGRQIGSRRMQRVAATLETRDTDNPPVCVDALKMPAERTDTRTPEQWVRAVFESAPREVALVPSAGVAGGAGPPARTALGVDDRPADPARGKLDGSLDHPRVLHTAPGTPALGGCRPDPSADDSLPPRAGHEHEKDTVRDRLKSVRDSRSNAYKNISTEIWPFHRSECFL